MTRGKLSSPIWGTSNCLSICQGKVAACFVACANVLCVGVPLAKCSSRIPINWKAYHSQVSLSVLLDIVVSKDLWTCVGPVAITFSFPFCFIITYYTPLLFSFACNGRYAAPTQSVNNTFHNRHLPNGGGWTFLFSQPPLCWTAI